MTVMSKRRKFIIDPEFGVDSRYEKSEGKELDSITLMEARLERMKRLSKEEVLRAKLLQLKLKMEDYLKAPVYDNQDHFAHFVQSYVDAIYTKRSDFAKDVSITPVFLSQVINSHREPTEEFILKLMIHSEKVFKSVGGFHKKTWYQVYFHEKLCDTMSNQEEWRPRIEEQVKSPEL
jgi:hypothetical protein